MRYDLKIFSVRNFLSFILLFLFGFASAVVNATEISFGVTSSELLAEACPESNWKGLKHTIEITMGSSGNSTTSTPWKDAADTNAFKGYIVSYQIIETLSYSSVDNLTNDALTVASQCIMRRNAIVDNNFGRNTDSTDKPQHVAIQALSLVMDRYLADSSDRELKIRNVEWVEVPENLVPLTNEEISSANLILREYLRMSK